MEQIFLDLREDNQIGMDPVHWELIYDPSFKEQWDANLLDNFLESLLDAKQTPSEIGKEQTELHVLDIAPIDVGGREFYVLRTEEGGVAILDLAWHLIGRGATFAEAYKDLMRDSRALLRHYMNRNSANISFEAQEMIRFLVQTVDHSGAYDQYHDLDLLFKNVEDSRVYQELDKHIKLLPILVKAIERLRESFPSEKFVIEFQEDPEGEVEGELYFVVHTPDEPEVAMDKLDLFDNWWICHSPDVLNTLSFHLTYE